MRIIRTKRDLEDFVSQAKSQGHSIGLVPTMGALHQGHQSLVERAVADNDVAIVSVFVNPTQFNNPEDLRTYPRDEKRDIDLLAGAGASAAFLPTPEEMYPEGMEAAGSHIFDLGQAAEVMEGPRRPGHFQGVAQIVSRLFRLCRPDRAYFGEKDFQQIAVIRRMVEIEGFKIDIVDCPIVREADGLAMSSRNVRLDAAHRATAPEIHRILESSAVYAANHTVKETEKYVTDRINATEGLETEYFSIVDPLTMQPVSPESSPAGRVGCVTVYCGNVRLIDNIKY